MKTLKGKNVQAYFSKQVRSKNWSSKNTYEIRGKNEKNPTFKQPGNAVVEFCGRNGSYNAPTYNGLKGTIKNPNFRDKRKTWKKTTLDKVNFHTKAAQANMLLDFEGARRIEKGSLSKPQVNRAINAVMNSNTSQYPKQVNL